MNAKKRTQAELEYLGAVKRLRAKRSDLAREFGHPWSFLRKTAYATGLEDLEAVNELRLACLPLSLVSILLALRESKEFSNDDRPASWSRIVDKVVRLRKQALGAALGRRIAAARNMKPGPTEHQSKGGNL